MATRIAVQIEPIVHGDTSVTNTGLVVKDVEAGDIFSVSKSVDRALSSATLSAVRVYYVRGATAIVNLKCSVTHVATGTPSLVVDAGFVGYALEGTTGQIDSFDIATPLTTFIGIDENDSVGLGIERKSDDTGEFEIFKIEFEFNKDAGESATAQVYDIITLARVKDFLAIPSSTSDDDNFLQTYISQFSLEIESEIQNKVRSQTVTDEIGNGNGRSKYRPKFFPIVSLTEAQYLDDTTWTDIEDDVIINSPELSQVSAQNSHNLELTESVWPEGTQNIKLTYVAGWLTIPSTLSLVCLEKTVELYRNSGKKGGGRFGLQSFSVNEGGGSKNTQYKDLTERHRVMLNPYRRPY
jgi:hypothetical protein